MTYRKYVAKALQELKQEKAEISNGTRESYNTNHSNLNSSIPMRPKHLWYPQIDESNSNIEPQRTTVRMDAWYCYHHWGQDAILQRLFTQLAG